MPGDVRASDRRQFANALGISPSDSRGAVTGGRCTEPCICLRESPLKLGKFRGALATCQSSRASQEDRSTLRVACGTEMVRDATAPRRIVSRLGRTRGGSAAMTVGRFSTRPLHLQLRDALLGRIVAGEWQVGARMPSESKLAQEYGVSPDTVRKALDLLERERVLTRRQGRGHLS